MSLTWKEVRYLLDAALKVKELVTKAGYDPPAWIDTVIARCQENMDPPEVVIDLGSP